VQLYIYRSLIVTWDFTGDVNALTRLKTADDLRTDNSLGTFHPDQDHVQVTGHALSSIVSYVSSGAQRVDIPTYTSILEGTFPAIPKYRN